MITPGIISTIQCVFTLKNMTRWRKFCFCPLHIHVGGFQDVIT